MASTPRATHVELDTNLGVLSIDWTDEVHTDFSVSYLRGWCPCARCQGHFNGVKVFVESDATIVTVEPVGGYGMRIQWLDGHKSGIYSFRYLREIYEEPPGDGITNQQMLADEAEDRQEDA